MGSVQDFRSASNKAEALDWLAELGEDAQVLAGGTDVMIQYLRGDIKPRVLVHIERIPELRGIEDNGRVGLGALTTHLTLGQDRSVSNRFPALAESARTVGGLQTQVVGTVGGNICNASPAADLAPPLLVADAWVTLENSGGERSIPLAEFFQGRRQTARAADELLTAITIEPLSERSGEVYLKLGRRGAMEVAIVGLAVRLTFDLEGKISEARIALCSVAPRPYRAKEVEVALQGAIPGGKAVAEAGRLLADSASPIDDVRSQGWYRRATVAPLLERAVLVCEARAKGGASAWS